MWKTFLGNPVNFILCKFSIAIALNGYDNITLYRELDGPGCAKHFKCAPSNKILGKSIFVENLTLEKEVLEHFLCFDSAVLF